MGLQRRSGFREVARRVVQGNFQTFELVESCQVNPPVAPGQAGGLDLVVKQLCPDFAGQGPRLLVRATAPAQFVAADMPFDQEELVFSPGPFFPRDRFPPSGGASEIQTGSWRIRIRLPPAQISTGKVRGFFICGCGAAAGSCPAGALSSDPVTMQILSLNGH